MRERLQVEPAGDSGEMKCEKKIGPFDCCSVVQGDCLELMKSLPDGCFDLCLTDPPYGVHIARKAKAWGDSPDVARVPTGEAWDDQTPNKAVFDQIFRISRNQIVFGANYFWENFRSSQCYIVWDKRGNLPAVPFADTEFAWTSFDRMSRKYTHIKHGFIRDDDEIIQHPCQKPAEMFADILDDFSRDDAVIFDPFLGSGTTAVAAKKLGRHFLGFEISAEYCAIAHERLARIDAQPKLFEPKAEQLLIV